MNKAVWFILLATVSVLLFIMWQTHGYVIGESRIIPFQLELPYPDAVPQGIGASTPIEDLEITVPGEIDFQVYRLQNQNETGNERMEMKK